MRPISQTCADAEQALALSERELSELVLCCAAEEEARLRGQVEALERRVEALEKAHGTAPLVPGPTSSVAEELDRSGIVVLPGAVSAEQCEVLRGRLEEVLASLPDEWPWEDARLIQKVQGDGYRGLEGYGEIAACNKPVLIKRTRGDVGMLDLMHVDRILPELATLREDPEINQLITEAGGSRPDLKVMNAYVNRSITQTRGWHYDAFYTQFKAFLYLTDVPDESFGPYCYVAGSHRAGLVRTLNRRIQTETGGRETDAALWDPAREVKVLGSAGTLIVSNQSGIHRGWPQLPGRERVLIAVSFIRENRPA